jgi:SAM-dependent methyltransferase
MGAGMRRFVHGLRTEGGGRRRETAAVACGVFIGCQPFYGFHFAMCWAAGWLLGLNRLKVYLAANISNPLVAPFLVFAELQAGSWLRRGSFHPLTLDAVRETGVVALGLDLLLGSAVLGGVLALAAGWATWAAIGPDRGDDPFPRLVRRAADRYVSASVTAWEFARGKLTHDPVYRAALFEGLLGAPLPPTGAPAAARAPAAAPGRPEGAHEPSHSRTGGDSGHRVLSDIGCGQGLMLALLAEAHRLADAGEPALANVPRFDRMVGVETRARVAAIARAALGADAEIIAADARTAPLPDADVVLLFDVLHLMPAGDQDMLLAAIVRHLAPGGVLLVREADAGAGWRFRCVQFGNRLKAIAVGRPRQAFHFRTAGEWVATLARHGVHAETRAMGQGTPFGNVLLSARRAHDVHDGIPRAGERRVAAPRESAHAPVR